MLENISPEDLAMMVASIIGVFSTLATATPNRSANGIVQFVLTFINVLGMNMGKAKNDPRSR